MSEIVTAVSLIKKNINMELLLFRHSADKPSDEKSFEITSFNSICTVILFIRISSYYPQQFSVVVPCTVHQ